MSKTESLKKMVSKLTPEERAIVVALLTPHTEPIDLDKLHEEYSFDESFPKELNTLYADEHKRLFLASVEEGKVYDLHMVTLKEALEWYVRCAPFSTSGSGSVELLCELAAKQLK